MHGHSVKEKDDVVPGPGQYQPNSKPTVMPISYAYSFSGRRPKDKKPKEVPGPGNYDLQNLPKSKHGAVFGSSHRNGSANHEPGKVPGPGSYSAAEAAAKIMTGPKYGFGTANKSRDDLAVLEAAVIPGPGAYQTVGQTGKEGKKFTMPGRPKSTNKIRTDVPGPAAYEPKLLSNKKGPLLKIPIIKNRKKEDIPVPGPGKYEISEKYRSVKKASPSWKYGFVICQQYL